MINLLKKCKKHYIISALITIDIILIIYLLIFPLKKEVLLDNSKGDLHPSVIMENKTKYSQTFISSVSDLEKIGIPFSTYMIENKNSKVVIQLSKNDKVITEKKVNIEDLKDNQIYYLEFEPISDSINEKYTLTFYYDTFEKNSSLAYWYFIDEAKDKMKINSKSEDYTMRLYTFGKQNNYYTIWLPSLILAFLISIMIIIDEGGGKIEK